MGEGIAMLTLFIIGLSSVLCALIVFIAAGVSKLKNKTGKDTKAVQNSVEKENELSEEEKRVVEEFRKQKARETNEKK